MLLPFMEGQTVYQLIDYGYQPDCFAFGGSRTPATDPGNYVRGVDVCPSDPNGGQKWNPTPAAWIGYHGNTNYFGSIGTSTTANDGILFYGSRIGVSDVLDGTSNTIIMGERGAENALWWGWCYCGFGVNGFGDGDSLPFPRNSRWARACPTGTTTSISGAITPAAGTSSWPTGLSGS